MNYYEKFVDGCEDHWCAWEGEGLLNVDKDLGWTSHDVVAKFRGLLGIRKIGHTGTLDPSATGILLLCVGSTTKMARFLIGLEKTYLATMRLGGQSDTLDAQGRISLLPHPPNISRQQVEKIFEQYTGKLQQIPPMYSAVKHRGQPLYKLARRGKTIPRKPREITVRSLDMMSFEPPQVRFRVVCSAGTYVRSLAADIGQQLGCGAYLEELRRTRLGPFWVEEALTMDRATWLARKGELKSYLQPVIRGLTGYRRLLVHPWAADAVLQGKPITRDMVKEMKPDVTMANDVRVEDENNRLLAMARLLVEVGELDQSDPSRPICQYLCVLS